MLGETLVEREEINSVAATRISRMLQHSGQSFASSRRSARYVPRWATSRSARLSAAS